MLRVYLSITFATTDHLSIQSTRNICNETTPSTSSTSNVNNEKSEKEERNHSIEKPIEKEKNGSSECTFDENLNHLTRNNSMNFYKKEGDLNLIFILLFIFFIDLEGKISFLGISFLYSVIICFIHFELLFLCPSWTLTHSFLTFYPY